MEERAGVAERDRPRMDPPNVFWFFGAFVIAFGVYALIEAIPKSQDGVWRLVTAVGFFAAFAVLAGGLLRRRWWVPGGLAAALAVATFPAVAVGFLQLIHVWPDDTGSLIDDFVSGYVLSVAVATAAVGVLAFWLTSFPFIFALVTAAALISAQLLAASSFMYSASLSGPNANGRIAAALVAGSVLVIIGIFLDVFARRRDAFWFHAFGWLSVAFGIVYVIVDPSLNADHGWAPMLIVGLVLLVAASPIRRATWAVYGVLGFYAAVVHYLAKGLDQDHWPFALLLLALGLSIFVFGMVAHRYGRAWAGRFVRRPPPSLGV